MKKIFPLSFIAVIVAFSLFGLRAPKTLAAGDPVLFDKGMVSLSFDDGDKSAYDAIATGGLLHNFKSTQYIITAATICTTSSGGAFCDDFMSASNLQTLYNSGHEIGAHTRTDVCSAEDACASGIGSAGLAPHDLQFQVDGLRQDLLQNVGIFPPVDTFAYPFGSYDAALTDKLKSAGIVGARTVDFIDAQGQPTFNTKTSDRYHLFAAQVNANTPITALDPDPDGFGSVEEWIDQAVTAHKWFILVFHEIKADCGTELFCTTPTNLSTIVAYLESKGAAVSVPTVGQGLALMNSQPVSDGVAPVITQADISASSTSAAGAPVTFAPVVTDSDAGLPATLNTFCTIPTLVENANWGVSFTTPVLSGDNFPMGVTTVTCTAADTGGNIATKTFTITVADGGPVITGIPTDFTVQTTSAAGAVVTYVLPTALDATDGARPVTCTPASGTTFVVGATLVTCSATDLAAHTTTTTFTITVQLVLPTVDITSPLPGSLVAGSTATINFTATNGTTVDCKLDDGEFLPCSTTASQVYNGLADGSHTVTVRASDGATNLATDSVIFTVDASVPVITLTGSNPQIISVGDAYTELGATVADSAGPAPVLTINSSAVDTNTAGLYQVTYDAVDAAGNHAVQVVRTVNVGVPVIGSESAMGTNSTDVTFTWTTNHPTTSRVIYDTVAHNLLGSSACPAPNAALPCYGYTNTTSEDPTLTTTHSVTISGLTTGTTYFFRPVSHGSPETVGMEIAITPTSPLPSSGGGTSPSVSSGIPTPLAGQVLGANTNTAHGEGTLVLDGSTIYLIKDGQRYGFRDANEYLSHGYTFAQVVPANAGDLSLTFDQTHIIKAKAGTLVLDTTDNRTVYMIGTDGTKRGFVSAKVFTDMGYTFDKIWKINLADYPSGSNM